MAVAPQTFKPHLPSVRQPVAVRFSEAAIRRGGRTIWSGVDLEVAAGEVVAVLGPNGGGKSTLPKAMIGLRPLHAGSVTVFDHRVRRGNDSIGYLPQRRSFDPDLRIRGRDLVRLGLAGRRPAFPVPA